MKVTVRIDDLGASETLRSLLGVLEHRIELHELMGDAVKDGVVRHLRSLNSRSPNSNFYSLSALSSENTPLQADGTGATVSIPHRGLALRLHGGRVLPKNVKNLALPTKHVPMSSGENEGRMGPRDMGMLAFIAARKGVEGTTGYLVEGVEKLITRGKRKGQKRIVPKPMAEGGRMMFVLRGWTDHDPDPGVLPNQQELEKLAADGAAAFVELYTG